MLLRFFAFRISLFVSSLFVCSRLEGRVDVGDLIARTELAESYGWCYRVARGSGSSFYRAFWLLNRRQRQAMFALYAFARITDDLGDDAQPAACRAARLIAWSRLLEEQLSGSALDGTYDDTFATRDLSQFAPLWPALRDTVSNSRIPIQLLQELVAGVEMDLGAVRLRSWTEVDHYAYCVASTVGLACTHIWQAADTLPRQHAIDCGIAFQLTNILRDLREDAARDRIYLPLGELERFGCDVDSWLAGRPRGEWQALVASVIDRTRALYDSGSHTIDHLPRQGKRMFWLMWSHYRRLLETISDRKEQLWGEQRIGLSRRSRYGLMFRALVTPAHSESLVRGL